jgi:hypothetical protein
MPSFDPGKGGAALDRPFRSTILQSVFTVELDGKRNKRLDGFAGTLHDARVRKNNAG